MIPLAIQKHETSTEFSIDIPYTIIFWWQGLWRFYGQYTIPVIYFYYLFRKYSDVFWYEITDWATVPFVGMEKQTYF